MRKVEWIKLNIDMFSNPKIKKLRRLPEGNNILLIWIMLLTMAGRCNAGGMIFISENLLYTPEDLADELGFSVDTIKLAIRVFEEYGMVVSSDEGIEIANWDLYQSVDGLEKIREQTRIRVANCRERKAIEKCNVTSNVTVTHSSYSYSKSKSNIFNLNSLLEDKEYIDNKENYKDYIIYILGDERLLASLRQWFSYKDEKKDRYAESSILAMIKKFVIVCGDYGISQVEDVVEYSICNGYKGVVWDRLVKKIGKSNSDLDEWGMMLEAERGKNNG